MYGTPEYSDVYRHRLVVLVRIKLVQVLNFEHFHASRSDERLIQQRYPPRAYSSLHPAPDLKATRQFMGHSHL